MEKPTRSFSPAAIVGASAILSLAIAGAAIWRVSGGFSPKSEETLLSMPETGAPDLRISLPDPWQAVQVPKAVKFDPPAGTEHAALVAVTTKFSQPDEKRGLHLGEDIDGIGGANSDLGDAVFSIGDGLVIFAGEPSPEWGNVVVISHTGPDGKAVNSLYGHLDRIEVKRGALVARGAKIGTMGTANGYHPAHLHFEMRSGDAIDLGTGYAAGPLNRLDPAATLLKFRDPAADGLSPSPLSSM